MPRYVVVTLFWDYHILDRKPDLALSYYALSENPLVGQRGDRRAAGKEGEAGKSRRFVDAAECRQRLDPAVPKPNCPKPNCPKPNCPKPSHLKPDWRFETEPRCKRISAEAAPGRGSLCFGISPTNHPQHHWTYGHRRHDFADATDSHR